MKSQIQKEKKEWRNYGTTDTNTTIFQTKPFREGTKTFFGKQNMGRLF